mgnify:CR=1 FL=1
MRRPPSGLLLGIGAALSISLTNVFSRLHFEAGSNPVTFMLVRYVLFVAIVATGLALLGRLPRVAARQVPDTVGAGLLNVIGATCLAFAIERVEVGLAIAVLYLFPILTSLIGAALDRRRPPGIALAALALAFIGLVLALDIGGDARPDPLGLAFAFGAALSIAGSFVWIERRLDTLGDAARTLGLATVALGFVVALAGVRGGVVFPLPSAWAWLTLVIATVTFGAAYAAMFAAISRVGATTTSMLMNLEPPATAVLATLLLGDRLSGTQLLGIALVVIAVLSAQRASLGPARPGGVPAPDDGRSR